MYRWKEDMLELIKPPHVIMDFIEDWFISEINYVDHYNRKHRPMDIVDAPIGPATIEYNTDGDIAFCGYYYQGFIHRPIPESIVDGGNKYYYLKNIIKPSSISSNRNGLGGVGPAIFNIHENGRVTDEDFYEYGNKILIENKPVITWDDFIWYFF